MSNAAAPELQKLLRRYQKYGADETTQYVLHEMGQRPFSVWCANDFAYYLLRHGHFEASGRLLKAIRRLAAPHPLVDETYGKWMWTMGRKAAAMRFVSKRALYWQHSILFSLLSAMWRVSGDEEKADRYIRLAEQLAVQELQMPPRY